MLQEHTRRDVEKAVVTLVGKGGQGVYIGNYYILTAAHCINFSCEGGMVLGDYYIEEIRTYDGKLLKATPIAVEPLSDIAVLSSPDNQEFYKEAEDIDAFCDETEPVPIFRKQLPLNVLETKAHEIPVLTNSGTPTRKKEIVEISERVYIHTHKGTWITGKATYLFPFHHTSLWVVVDEQVEGGTSGGPIINESGEVIGIASHFSVITDSNLKCEGGTPRPHLTLPVWVCNRIWPDD